MKISYFTGRFQNAHHGFVLRILFGMVVVSFYLAFPCTVDGAVSFRNELFSLEVNKKPLSDVLNQISETTGYEFEIAEQWDDFPVTVAFVDLPLHEGLKRILNGLNNAVIYDSDGKIKILIYGKVEDERRPSGRFDREPISRVPRPYIRPPVGPPPSIQSSDSSEKEETSETDQEDSEQSEDSDQESKEESAESEQEDSEKSNETGQESKEESAESEQEDSEKAEKPAQESGNVSNEGQETAEDRSEETGKDTLQETGKSQ
jgi:hypothetical protein